MSTFDSYFFAALASALAPNLRVVGAQVSPHLPRYDAAGNIVNGIILTEKGTRYDISVATQKSAQQILERRAHIGYLWKFYKEPLRHCDFQVEQTVFYGTVPTDISVTFSNMQLPDSTPLTEEPTYDFRSQSNFSHKGSSSNHSRQSSANEASLYPDMNSPAYSGYRSSTEASQDSDFNSSTFSTMLLASQRGFSAVPSPQMPDRESVDAVLITRHLKGFPVSPLNFTSLQAASVGVALSQLHQLSTKLFPPNKVLSFSSQHVRQHLETWLKHLRKDPRIPGILFEHWDYMIDLDHLWDYKSRIIHGDFLPNDLFFNETGIASIQHWERLQIGDPAYDFGWLVNPQIPSNIYDEILGAYGRAMGSRMDPFIFPRAQMWYQLNIVSDFLRALETEDSQTITRARQTLRHLVSRLPAPPVRTSQKVSKPQKKSPAPEDQQQRAPLSPQSPQSSSEKYPPKNALRQRRPQDDNQEILPSEESIAYSDFIESQNSPYTQAPRSSRLPEQSHLDQDQSAHDYRSEDSQNFKSAPRLEEDIPPSSFVFSSSTPELSDFSSSAEFSSRDFRNESSRKKKGKAPAKRSSYEESPLSAEVSNSTLTVGALLPSSRTSKNKHNKTKQERSEAQTEIVPPPTPPSLEKIKKQSPFTHPSSSPQSSSPQSSSHLENVADPHNSYLANSSASYNSPQAQPHYDDDYIERPLDYDEYTSERDPYEEEKYRKDNSAYRVSRRPSPSDVNLETPTIPFNSESIARSQARQPHRQIPYRKYFEKFHLDGN